MPGALLEDNPYSSLDGLSNAERLTALERYRIIRPFLDAQTSLTAAAQNQGISLRSAQRWVESYRRQGLIGLTRKIRTDARAQIFSPLRDLIEGLALQRPQPSAATIHRKILLAAKKLDLKPPSYAFVHKVISRLNPGLLTLAQEGAKGYSNAFDLIHRREAEGPNAIWQADHTELDILVRDEQGQARKPWLTIIIDDYSRAIAAFLLSFSSPSAHQTALALRQAIWRKPQPGWHICGIPQVLYTDHGSDFTSQHIEQVTVALKIQMIFSAVGKPRGRGKVERFFESLSQVFLSALPGYCRSQVGRSSLLSLPQLNKELERYLIEEYLVTTHSATKQAPQSRWEKNGFLPQMPDSLERLDLLLLTVPKTRRVRPDGIHFNSLRYIDPMLAAYVGESIVLRYDPHDMAEVRVFYKDKFLCRAVCQELAGEVVPLREIVRARDRQRRALRATIEDRRRTVDALLEARRFDRTTPAESPPLSAEPPPPLVRLKRYLHD